MATIIAVLVTSLLFINSAYQAAHAQRERAETHLQLARDLIDDTYNEEIQRLKDAPWDDAEAARIAAQADEIL